MIDITNRFQLRGSILSINQSNDDLIIITQYYDAFKLDTSLKLKALPHKYSKLSGSREDVRVHIYDRFQCEGFYTLYRESRDLAFGSKGDMLEGVFRDYSKIQYWSKNIKNIYKIVYIREFKNASKIDWNKSNYIDIFGKDDEIVDFCAKNAMDSILENSDDERIKIEFRHQKTLQ